MILLTALVQAGLVGVVAWVFCRAVLWANEEERE